MAALGVNQRDALALAILDICDIFFELLQLKGDGNRFNSHNLPKTGVLSNDSAFAASQTL
jgi:hypothetical protein